MKDVEVNTGRVQESALLLEHAGEITERTSPLNDIRCYRTKMMVV